MEVMANSSYAIDRIIGRVIRTVIPLLFLYSPRKVRTTKVQLRWAKQSSKAIFVVRLKRVLTAASKIYDDPIVS